MAKRVTLTAVKPLRYAGRALRAGDAFEASDPDARVLIGARLATYATRAPDPLPRRRRPDPAPRPTAAPARPAAAAPGVDREAVPEGELETLRTRYQELAGRRAHPFWRAARVAAEIAALEQDPTQ
mgnify:CR=1 FL=1